MNNNELITALVEAIALCERKARQPILEGWGNEASMRRAAYYASLAAEYRVQLEDLSR